MIAILNAYNEAATEDRKEVLFRKNLWVRYCYLGDLRVHNSTAKNFEMELFSPESLSVFGSQMIEELTEAMNNTNSTIRPLEPAEDFFIWRIKSATVSLLQDIGAAVGSSLPGYRFYRHVSQPSYFRNHETLRKAIRIEFQTSKELNSQHLRTIKGMLYSPDYYLIYAQGRSKESRLQIYKYFAENESWAVQCWIDDWNRFFND